MFSRRWASVVLCQLLVWQAVAATALGQASPPKPMDDKGFSELLQARCKQVDDLRDLDEAAKTKARDLYDQALQEMDKAKASAARIASFEQRAAQAPAELAQTKLDLAALPAEARVSVPGDVTLTQIEQAITQRGTELEAWRRELANIETELKGRASRRAEIPKQVSAVQQILTDINSELQAPAPADESSPVNSARRLMLLAKRRAAEAEVLSYQKELAAAEARADVLPLLRDLSSRRVALGEQEIKQWQEICNQRRQQEAEQEARQAAWEAGQADPAIKQLLDRNAALAAERKQVSRQIAEATQQLHDVSKQLTTLDEQFQRARERIEMVGLTNTNGMILRKQRETLPDLRVYRRNIAARQQTIREGQLHLWELQYCGSALADIDQQTQAVLQQLNWPKAGANRLRLELAVREALATQREYLDALGVDLGDYFNKLVDLDNAERQLIGATERYSRFIDERVLWIGSTTPLTATDFRGVGEAVWWLAGPPSLLRIVETWGADAMHNPLTWLGGGSVALALTLWRRRLRRRIALIGERAARKNCCQFWPTIEAAALTAAVAAAWPGLAWYLGWRLTAAADAAEVCKAVGVGLTAVAGLYAVLELFRQVCAARGLAEAHFGWPPGALRLVRVNLRWLRLLVLPLLAVAAAMRSQGREPWDSSLGRLAFLAAMLGFALVARRILRPTGGVFQAMVVNRRGGWLDRLRYLWYLAGALTPAALAVLAAAGYYYTAQQLAARLAITANLLAGLVLVRAVLVRWIAVNRQRLAIGQARLRRAAQQETGPGDEAEKPGPAALPPERDLAAINLQTRRLVEYSLALAATLAIWCVWIDVLPAFNVLHRVQLWPAFAVTGSLTAGDGQLQPKELERPGTVTLADVALAVVVLATSVIAARNIPGLLEMAVLQHLPMDAGARYALATLSRYVITVVGVLVCFGALGVGWSKVQWLVAGMGVGLGFGLQEIFANFVSGLIILFERPVRVGDVVTIDQVSGLVSRIRIRATTITDWDRKELIIPNKEFITGRVLNWTLSDKVNRLLINVQVAYGSNTQLTTETLLRLAKEHAGILADPPPEVVLESLADGSLKFVLTCFLPNFDHRGTIVHDLHVAIDREFRLAGIDFALPQQEVHLRSIDFPLPFRPPVGALERRAEKAA